MTVATVTDITVSGKVTRTPIVRPKVIFSTIEHEGSLLQVTLFTQNAPSHYADMISNWELGQEVTVTGKMEDNPFNGQPQIVVSSMPGAAPSPEPVTNSQSITITSATEDFKDQWGRTWIRVPDRF